MRNFVDYYTRYTERLSGINEAVIGCPDILVGQMENQFSKRIREIAEFIGNLDCGHKIIMLAGPSSSGKTTTSKMLCNYLSEIGMESVQVSLDDFFLSRDLTPLLPNGNPDYETVNAIDIPLLHKCMLELINNGESMIPEFDFISGNRKPESKRISIGDNDVIIFEGIHALNPIISGCLPTKNLINMYISVKQGIKDGDDTILYAHDLRLIRRAVRDAQFRGSDLEKTLDMWQQVRRGEELYIYPYKYLSDITVNTIHIYEPCVLKQLAIPLFEQISTSNKYYEMVQHLIANLNRFETIPLDKVPENSLLREFIGGGIY